MNEQIILMLEVREERQELKSMGLSNEEIDGFIDFFIEDWMESLRAEMRCAKTTGAANEQ